jgi:hypothetical protein
MGAMGWLRLAALALATVALALQRAEAQTPAPFSDDFTADQALRAGWILSEPNPSSRHSFGPGGLLLEASGEHGGSDLWLGTNFRASLLLQPIQPSASWTIVAHFEFRPVIDFQAAGIVLTTQTGGFSQTSRFHRFELSFQNGHDGLAVSSYLNGPIDPDFAPYRGNEIYLKLTKAGSTYTYSYSATGDRWIRVSTLIDPTPYCYVGLDTIRQPWHGGPRLFSQARFRSFEIQISRLGSEVDSCSLAVSSNAMQPRSW